MYLKFVYLVKLLSNPKVTLSSENLENTNNFEGCDLTLLVYKKMYKSDEKI